MAITRTDTLNEEIAMILMDVFSILASVGFIMVLLIIVISDYVPPPPGLTELDFNPVIYFEESKNYTKVTDAETKKILSDLNIDCSKPDLEVKKTNIYFYDGRVLCDSANNALIDFDKSLGKMKYQDIITRENGSIEFMRLIFCPDILIEGVNYEDCVIYIPFDDVIEGKGQYSGIWMIGVPTINIYIKDKSGKYIYNMDLIEADFPAVKKYLFRDFLLHLRNSSKG